MSTYVLQYFPIRGRAEFIRYILAYGQIPYTNKEVKPEDWPTVLPTTPMGSLPVLEVDGKCFCQSLTIGRFLAGRAGILGSDEWNRTYADMLANGMADLRALIGPYSVAFRSKNHDNLKEVWAGCKANMKPWFERYENFLGSDKQWFCGNEITWADLVVAEFVDKIERCVEAGFIDEYPHLKAHSKRVHELPNIAKYVSSRQAYVF